MEEKKLKIRFKKLRGDAVMPSKAHATDAGFDLVATSQVFDEHGCVSYGTGIAVEIPKGYVGLLFPRSSVFKTDLSLSNCVGVIDSGYRGEVKAKFRPQLTFADRNGIGDGPGDYLGTASDDIGTQVVTFHGRDASYPDVDEGCEPFRPRCYEVGERIVQMVVMPYPEVEFEESDALSDSDRGEGGYGSSGR